MLPAGSWHASNGASAGVLLARHGLLKDQLCLQSSLIRLNKAKGLPDAVRVCPHVLLVASMASMVAAHAAHAGSKLLVHACMGRQRGAACKCMGMLAQRTSAGRGREVKEQEPEWNSAYWWWWLGGYSTAIGGRTACSCVAAMPMAHVDSTAPAICVWHTARGERLPVTSTCTIKSTSKKCGPRAAPEGRSCVCHAVPYCTVPSAQLWLSTAPRQQLPGSWVAAALLCVPCPLPPIPAVSALSVAAGLRMCSMCSMCSRLEST